jgi:hypothetical protein
MIESYRFGSMTVMGKVHHSDLKIIGKTVIGNWWRREGHAIHVEDIGDILAAPVEILVVGKGDPGRMQVTDQAVKALEGKGIQLFSVPTKEAVSIFNKLDSEGKRVAGAFHLTC